MTNTQRWLPPQSADIVWRECRLYTQQMNKYKSVPNCNLFPMSTSAQPLVDLVVSEYHGT